MPVEMLTYAMLGERLHCSPEAARALVKRLRLPRQKAVSVDLSEINHKPLPARSPGDHQSVTEDAGADLSRRPERRGNSPKIFGDIEIGFI